MLLKQGLGGERLKRENWIDSCRFLAIFVIMATHFLAAFRPEALALWEEMPSRLLLGGVTGKFSVAFFFVLLGYFAGRPKPFSLPDFARYTLRRYFQFAFFAFVGTLLFLLGGYAVTWLFHTPDERVFLILSDGPRYNLIYLLRDGFLLEDHYIDTLWCMRDLFLASLVCRLFAYLPERLRPIRRAGIGLALIAVLLLVNARFFVWVCDALLGCVLRLLFGDGRGLRLDRPLPKLLLFLLCVVLMKLPLEEGPVLYFLQGLIASALLYLCFCTAWVQRLLSRAPLPWLGRIGMGLFVVHAPVYSLLLSSLYPLLTGRVAEGLLLIFCFCLSVGLSVLGAWLLHRAYDAALRLTRREKVTT